MQVPPRYFRAEENARKLTRVRDDDDLGNVGDNAGNGKANLSTRRLSTRRLWVLPAALCLAGGSTDACWHFATSRPESLS